MRKIVMMAAGVVCLVLASATTASAGQPKLPGGHVVTKKTPMTLHRQVSAKTKGSKTVVTLDNGAHFAVPTHRYQAAQRRLRGRVKPNTGRVRPNDTVFGNCGYSYTYLFDWYGVRQYRLAVGFHVDAPAVDYTWDAYVQGAGSTPYTYQYTAGGGLAFRSDWAGGHTGTVPASDYYDADTVYGAAELWYGQWCFAGYTSDATYVY